MLEKNKLRIVRESRNLSRKDIANIIGCSIDRIVLLEKSSESLTEKEQSILEQALNIDQGFLAFGKEELSIADGEYDQIIGKNVKYIRKKRGMTQGQLAEELGYAMPSSISAIERGIKPIGKKKMIQMAKVFDLHISDLFSPFDLSDTNSDAKLINDFMFLVRSDKEASVMTAIKALIESGCNELRKL